MVGEEGARGAECGGARGEAGDVQEGWGRREDVEWSVGDLGARKETVSVSFCLDSSYNILCSSFPTLLSTEPQEDLHPAPSFFWAPRPPSPSN